MIPTPLYPVRFEPIFQYRPWGGRRLANWLTAPLPADGPIGEAWLLSDRDDHPTLIANGPLQGQTIAQLMADSRDQLLGKCAGRFSRFPLLLKLLDARGRLSVQVHPSDQQTSYLPTGESGKTEAWVVLEAGAQSRIYAGLKRATTADNLRQAITNGGVTNLLVSFTPQPGDGILLEAGTVHALGDTVVFEVQENSDVTFRLYDWDRVDAAAGKRRALQVEPALACIDFARGAPSPMVPVIEEGKTARRERLVHCKHFGLWRIAGDTPFSVGLTGAPRVVVCIAGEGQLEKALSPYPFTKGDVFLLPAAVGSCVCRPNGAVTLLEVSLPAGA